MFTSTTAQQRACPSRNNNRICTVLVFFQIPLWFDATAWFPCDAFGGQHTALAAENTSVGREASLANKLLTTSTRLLRISESM